MSECYPRSTSSIRGSVSSETVKRECDTGVEEYITPLILLMFLSQTFKNTPFYRPLRLPNHKISVSLLSYLGIRSAISWEHYIQKINQRVQISTSVCRPTIILATAKSTGPKGISPAVALQENKDISQSTFGYGLATTVLVPIMYLVLEGWQPISNSVQSANTFDAITAMSSVPINLPHLRNVSISCA